MAGLPHPPSSISFSSFNSGLPYTFRKVRYMGNVFTLESLREEAEKKFSPVEIELPDGDVVTLRNMLRLPKNDRKKVVEKLKALEKVGEDNDGEETEDEVTELVRLGNEILMLVADQGRKLVKELDGDVAVIMNLIELWMGTTQPGEAKPSPAS